MCPLTRAHWRHLANTIELVLPLAHPSPQCKRQIDWFSHFCKGHSRVSSGMPQHVLSPNNCPFAWVVAPSNACFLAPTLVHNPNGISISSAVFAQITAECRYTLQWAAPRGSGPPSNTWFPWPTRIYNPNGISISSAVLAGFTTVTYRQTDRPRYSVDSNRPHLRT